MVEMDLKAASMIQLYLAEEVIYNMMDKEMATGLWSRFRNVVYDEKPL